MSATFESAPARYEREAMRTRQRLSSNLDQLAGNLTAGRMLDEVLGYARGGGASFLKGLGSAASENPIPTLLLGVSAAMFLSGKGRVGQAARYNGHRQDAARGNGHGASEAWQRLGDGANVAGSSLKHGAERTGATVAHAAQDIGENAASAASDAAHRVREGAEAAAHGVAEAGHAVAGAARSATDAVSSLGAKAIDAAASVEHTAEDYAKTAAARLAAQGEKVAEDVEGLAHQLSERIGSVAREQPLMVAAAGLAIGAAVAALLPRTALEDSLMGRTSDAVKDTVSEAAGHAFEEVQDAASRVAHEVADAANREGLTSGAVASAVRETGDKVRRVAEAGKHAAEDEMETHLSRESQGSRSAPRDR